MKTVFTLLLALITCAAYGHNKDTYQKLCEVNKCWTEQQDIQQLDMPAFDARGEREWIRTHLQLVEQVLRSRSTEGLSAAQTANRLTALSHLNEYWHDGNFPINDKYSYRTPIFIDRYDNFWPPALTSGVTTVFAVIPAIAPGWGRLGPRVACRPRPAVAAPANRPPLQSGGRREHRLVAGSAARITSPGRHGLRTPNQTASCPPRSAMTVTFFIGCAETRRATPPVHRVRRATA